MKDLTPERHAHDIFNDLRKKAIAKYMAGQKEHGGHLWEVPLPQMVEFAKEEVIDQGSYLWTMTTQITNLRLLCGELFESLEAGEDILHDEDKKLIDAISKLLQL